MKPEAESSVSKAKTKRRTAVPDSGPNSKRKAVKRSSSSKIESSVTPVTPRNKTVMSLPSGRHLSDLEFLDTVKETVYKKLLDNELDLKIDSGFKAIELKNKISETSENERLLLEILSEIRSEELNKSKS